MLQGAQVLDQIRTVDRLRLVKRVGEMDDAAKDEILAALADLFAP